MYARQIQVQENPTGNYKCLDIPVITQDNLMHIYSPTTIYHCAKQIDVEIPPNIILKYIEKDPNFLPELQIKYFFKINSSVVSIFLVNLSELSEICKYLLTKVEKINILETIYGFPNIDSVTMSPEIDNTPGTCNISFNTAQHPMLYHDVIYEFSCTFWHSISTVSLYKKIISFFLHVNAKSMQIVCDEYPNFIKPLQSLISFSRLPYVIKCITVNNAANYENIIHNLQQYDILITVGITQLYTAEAVIIFNCNNIAQKIVGAKHVYIASYFTNNIKKLIPFDCNIADKIKMFKVFEEDKIRYLQQPFSSLKSSTFFKYYIKNDLKALSYIDGTYKDGIYAYCKVKFNECGIKTPCELQLEKLNILDEFITKYNKLPSTKDKCYNTYEIYILRIINRRPLAILDKIKTISAKINMIKAREINNKLNTLYTYMKDFSRIPKHLYTFYRSILTHPNKLDLQNEDILNKYRFIKMYRENRSTLTNYRNTQVLTNFIKTHKRMPRNNNINERRLYNWYYRAVEKREYFKRILFENMFGNIITEKIFKLVRIFLRRKNKYSPDMFKIRKWLIIQRMDFNSKRGLFSKNNVENREEFKKLMRLYPELKSLY
jgi:hypothetical protein